MGKLVSMFLIVQVFGDRRRLLDITTKIQSSNYPDNEVPGANMWPTRVLFDPDGPHVAPWTLLSG